MRELEYIVVAGVVKKSEYLATSQAGSGDLYLHTLEVVIEQFCLEVGESSEAGFIYAERRRPDLDLELELAWNRLRRGENSRLRAVDVSGRVLELVLKDKRTMDAG